MKDILDGVSRKEFTRVGDVLLLGKGKHRQPTPSERMALRQKGIHCNVVTEFLRAQFHRLELRSVEYTVPGMNNNTNIYTWDDMCPWKRTFSLYRCTWYASSGKPDKQATVPAAFF